MRLLDKLLNMLLDTNTLYYPGCLNKYVTKRISHNYETILQKAGINFIKLSGTELCCGSPALNAGYSQDFKELAQKNYNLFKERGIKKIITPCPACYYIFGKKYAETLENWDITVEHATQTIHKALNDGRLKIKMKIKEKVTYHDPCHLGRRSRVYEEPREIIQMLGYEIVEMKDNKKKAMCCGAGGGLKNNNPELSQQIMNRRIKQAKELRIKKIITPCSMCYKQLRNSEIEIKELSEVVVDVV